MGGEPEKRVNAFHTSILAVLANFASIELLLSIDRMAAFRHVEASDVIQIRPQHVKYNIKAIAVLDLQLQLALTHRSDHSKFSTTPRMLVLASLLATAVAHNW